jgi:hypothetical protein
MTLPSHPAALHLSILAAGSEAVQIPCQPPARNPGEMGSRQGQKPVTKHAAYFLFVCGPHAFLFARVRTVIIHVCDRYELPCR